VTRAEAAALRAEFVRLLTADSPHHDARRRDFNQAVFMADGNAAWTATTLEMVMGKFDKAVKNLERAR
jgi:N-methylhydantoinase B/oxoprolinase/acetone carboxylase alpha subunit